MIQTKNCNSCQSYKWENTQFPGEVVLLALQSCIQQNQEHPVEEAVFLELGTYTHIVKKHQIVE